MEEFIKSLASFSWTLTVYGIAQGGNLLKGLPTAKPTLKATESFNETTKAIQLQFNGVDNAIFRPIETVQQAAIDLTFNFFSPSTFAPKTIWQTTENLVQWGAGIAAQFIPGGKVGTGGPPVGWGPVNIDDAELFYVPGGPAENIPESVRKADTGIQGS